MPRKKIVPPTMAGSLPTKEAKAHAHMSERSLHRYAEVGLLNKYYVGGRLRWSIAELDALVTRGRGAA